MPDRPNHHVRIVCSNPKANLILELGVTPLKITGGFEGWETVNRPFQTAMTQWMGGQPWQITFDVMLDGFRDPDTKRSVEPDLRSLMNVARGDAESPPGIITI